MNSYRAACSVLNFRAGTGARPYCLISAFCSAVNGARYRTRAPHYRRSPAGRVAGARHTTVGSA
jgi:hypothetical protein